jgi:hypothetical protein
MEKALEFCPMFRAQKTDGIRWQSNRLTAEFAGEKTPKRRTTAHNFGLLLRAIKAAQEIKQGAVPQGLHASSFFYP